MKNDPQISVNSQDAPELSAISVTTTGTPSPIGVWLLTIRPKTLTISVAPVMAGCALAWNQQQSLDWLVAITCLLGALLIQIGTNLHNDAADFERGADTPERIGPARATAQGWLTAGQVKRGALLSFMCAFLVGVYLAWVGGWPIIVLGLVSLAAGYAYTGGPKPIAYSASGELFVFLFFGIAAVAGCYYLQTGTISWQSLHVASAIGLLAAAVLLVNNYRDLETDQAAKKHTLAFHLGRRLSKRVYSAFMLTPFILPLTLLNDATVLWLLFLLLPFTLMLVRQFNKEAPGPVFNEILANTAKHQLAFSVLLSIGLIVTW